MSYRPLRAFILESVSEVYLIRESSQAFKELYKHHKFLSVDAQVTLIMALNIIFGPNGIPMDEKSSE